MKHVYPPRHPAWLDDASTGPAPTRRGDEDEAAQPLPDTGRREKGRASGDPATNDRAESIRRPDEPRR